MEAAGEMVIVYHHFYWIKFRCFPHLRGAQTCRFVRRYRADASMTLLGVCGGARENI